MSSMHLDEEQVQRVLHGELAPASASAVQAHLATCTHCASRVALAREDEERVLSLLRHLDHHPPRVDASVVFSSARRSPGWMRWAAGILVMLGAAGAAYAAPDSPLPGLVDRVYDILDRRPEPPPAAPDGSTADAWQGLAVTPTDRFTIQFSAEPTGGSAIVSLTDGDEVIVRAAGGAATFTSDVDRLTIAGRDASTTFAIEIPRGAAWLEMRVGDRRVFLKDGERVLIDSSSGAAPYIIPLTPRGR